MSPDQSGGKASQNEGKDKPPMESRAEWRGPRDPQPKPKRSDLAPPLLLLDNFPSDLPAELRKQTFFNVIRGRGAETQFPDTIRQISLSESTGTSPKEQQLVIGDVSPFDIDAPTFIEKVHDLDYAEAQIEVMIAKEKSLFNQFIAAVANKIPFDFRHPCYLEDFGEGLIPWLQHESSLCTKLHRRLHIFYDDEDWQSMSVYKKKEDIAPHGYSLGAEYHIKDWSRAVEAVVEAAKVCHMEVRVDLIFHRPYRHYLAIRGIFNFVFRQEKIGDKGSKIKMNMLYIDTAACRKSRRIPRLRTLMTTTLCLHAPYLERSCLSP